MARSNIRGRVRYKRPDGSFAFMGRRKYKMMLDAKRRAAKAAEKKQSTSSNPEGKPFDAMSSDIKSLPKEQQDKLQNNLGNLFGDNTGGNTNQNPANAATPNAATPPIKVSNPDTFFGGQQGVNNPATPSTPSLDLGTIDGSMGMTPV